ncbi:MAG: hypothetical protein AAF959_11100 [Cyanobacteria bacterium P01_D01_bin.56]
MTAQQMRLTGSVNGNVLYSLNAGPTILGSGITGYKMVLLLAGSTSQAVMGYLLVTLSYPEYNATQLRPGPGRWQLFRKASGIASGYHCILEWEAIQEPGDDTNQDPPTFQEFQEIQQQKRVFQEQVNEYSQQLQSLGKRMAVMQQNFDAERADLSGKLNDQSTMLFQISGKLESEQDLNQKQQRELASQRKRNHQVKIALVVLSVLVAVIAVVGAGIDVELIQQIAEWTLVIIGAVGALFGAMGLSEG